MSKIIDRHYWVVPGLFWSGLLTATGVLWIRWWIYMDPLQTMKEALTSTVPLAPSRLILFLSAALGILALAILALSLVVALPPIVSRAFLNLRLKKERLWARSFAGEERDRLNDELVPVELPQPLANFFRRPIDDLAGFSPSVIGALRDYGLRTVGDVVRSTEKDLLTVPEFGASQLDELWNFLADHGLSLGMRLYETRDGRMVLIMPRSQAHRFTQQDRNAHASQTPQKP